MSEIKWATTIDPNEYVHKFADGMLKLSSSSWSVEPEAGRKYVVRMPNRVELTIDLSEPNHFDEYGEQFQSTMLWYHSLGYLPRIYSITKDLSLINTFLNSYLEFLETVKWHQLCKKLTSLDHSVAMRLRAMCMLAAQISLNNAEIPISIKKIMSIDLLWASSPNSYANNNHGMMLAAGVIHAHYLFPGFDDAKQVNIAETKLSEIVQSAFDSNWVCKENTPIYQSFYIRFCESMLEFVNATNKETLFTEALENMIAPARETLQLQLLPNGDYPPLGDSGKGPSGYQSKDGSLYSQESGIYIEKNDGVYRSFKCGYSSGVHKHADDTSITLTIDNQEMILDAGLHSYDWSDPYTLAVKSQRGHSGIYFKKFDELYPGALYHPRQPRVASSIKMIDSPDDNVILQGNYIVDGTYRCERIAELGDTFIRINDTFNIDEQNALEYPIQRFLIPGDAELTLGPGIIKAKIQSYWLSIEFDALRNVEITRGSMNPTPRGWISREWAVALPCLNIELSCRDSWNSMQVSINYGRTNDKLTSFGDSIRN